MLKVLLGNLGCQSVLPEAISVKTRSIPFHMLYLLSVLLGVHARMLAGIVVRHWADQRFLA
jgi:hypothetical protein